MDNPVIAAYLPRMFARAVTMLAILAVALVTTLTPAHAARMSVVPDQAMHRTDMMQAAHIEIDRAALSRELGVPVIDAVGVQAEGARALLRALCDLGKQVSLETSGAIGYHDVDPRVTRVVDVKTPGSGETDRNLYDQLATLRASDQVKFVIADRADYDWSRERVATLGLASRCMVLFSPVASQLAPRLLADWIVDDNLPVRFQLQLHKVLWGDQPGK